MVAGFTHQIVQACALASQHQYAVAREVEAIVVRGATFVQPDDPEILLLQFLQGPHQVHHAGNTEVLRCARACLYRNGA